MCLPPKTVLSLRQDPDFEAPYEGAEIGGQCVYQ